MNPPANTPPRVALALSVLSLLCALAGCSEARSDTPPPPPSVTTAADERPGCRKEFPIEFRGISCAGHDYEPPIPYGELYPPR